jgi:AraC-like DNA-binding protein
MSDYLHMARDDSETSRDRQRQGIQIAKDAGKYAGRRADATVHDRIIVLRGAGHSIDRTSKLAGCSISQVKRIWPIHRPDSEGKGRFNNEDLNLLAQRLEGAYRWLNATISTAMLENCLRRYLIPVDKEHVQPLINKLRAFDAANKVEFTDADTFKKLD